MPALSFHAAKLASTMLSKLFAMLALAMAFNSESGAKAKEKSSKRRQGHVSASSKAKRPKPAVANEPVPTHATRSSSAADTPGTTQHDLRADHPVSMAGAALGKFSRGDSAEALAAMRKDTDDAGCERTGDKRRSDSKANRRGNKAARMEKRQAHHACYAHALHHKKTSVARVGGMR